VTRKT